MKAVAGVGTLHPAVTREEGAAPAQREAVGAVAAQEAALLHRGQGHRPPGPQGRHTGQGGVVGDEGVLGSRGVGR